MEYVAQAFDHPAKGAGGGMAVIGLLYCLTRRGKRSKKKSVTPDTSQNAPQVTKERVHDLPQLSRPSSASTNSSGVICDPQPGLVMDGTNARLLEAGSLVCLYTQQGELVTVTKADRFWELRTISAPTSPAAEGGVRLPFFPVESIFVIVRHNSRVGFRALGAEGRLLQAVQRPTEPHRVANYNFGAWESWELSSNGLANCRWTQKKLGLEIQELRIMALEDVRQAERQHIQATRELQTKLKTSGLQLAETEARLRELVKASQRQSYLSEQQIDDLEHQVTEACHREDAMKHELHRKNAALEQFEARLTEFSAERDRLSSEIDGQNEKLREMHSDQQRMREAHTQQLEVLTAEMERLHAEGLSNQSDDDDMDKLKMQLADSNNQLAKTQEEVSSLKDKSLSLLQQKEAEVKALKEERQFMEAALLFIKGHTDGSPWASLMSQIATQQDNIRSGPLLQSDFVPRSTSSSALPPTPDCNDTFVQCFPIFQTHPSATRDESRSAILSGTITPTSTVLLDLLTDRCSETNSGLATPRVVDHEEFHRLHCNTDDSHSAAASSQAPSENGLTSPMGDKHRSPVHVNALYGRGVRVNGEQVHTREERDEHYKTGSAVKEAIQRLNSGGSVLPARAQDVARDRPTSMVDYLSDSMASKKFDALATQGPHAGWDAPDGSSERSDDPGTPSDSSNATSSAAVAAVKGPLIIKRATPQPCARSDSSWGGRRSSFLDRPPLQGLEDMM